MVIFEYVNHNKSRQFHLIMLHISAETIYELLKLISDVNLSSKAISLAYLVHFDANAGIYICKDLWQIKFLRLLALRRLQRKILFRFVFCFSGSYLHKTKLLEDGSHRT